MSEVLRSPNTLYRSRHEQLIRTRAGIGEIALLSLASPAAAMHMLEAQTVDYALEPETLERQLEQTAIDQKLKISEDKLANAA